MPKSAAVAVAATEAITTQEVIIWWAGYIQSLLEFIAEKEDGMFFRYYGGFALNVLEGQLRGAPRGNLQASYDIGTSYIGYPASDIDVQVYGVPAEQELEAALAVLHHLDGEDVSSLSFEVFPDAARNWILSGMPIAGKNFNRERHHQYVMLRSFKTGQAPVKSILAKLHPYKVGGTKHYQIQIAGVTNRAGGLIELSQISFVQTPFPKQFVYASRVYTHDPWTLLKQFSALYDAIKDMPGMDDKIVKTARRIEVADGMVTHFEALERGVSQRQAQAAAQRALANLEWAPPLPPGPPPGYGQQRRRRGYGTRRRSQRRSTA